MVGSDAQRRLRIALYSAELLALTVVLAGSAQAQTAAPTSRLAPVAKTAPASASDAPPVADAPPADAAGTVAPATLPQGGSGAVSPQGTTSDDADNATSNADIVVTGSSIRGVAPVGSPLIGVSSDAIAAVAATNAKEVLATVPALGNFQTNAEQSTPARFRTTGYIPNIHNLGPLATLTLINGHRVSDTGTEETYTDPSTIPPIAIQRVEIVADGASAIYGADAVAGVVNFIYRKPFNGVEVQSTYSFDGETRYRRIEASIIGGKTWDGGGFMAAYTYSDNRSPLALEIPLLALGGDQRSNGGRDLRVTTCQTPTIRAATATGAPTGTTYGSAERNFSTTTADLRCGRIANVGIIPDGQRHAAVAMFEQRISHTIRFRGELNYGYNDTQVEEQRGAISVLVNRGTPSFNAQNIPPALFNNPAVTRVSVSRSSVGLLSPTYTALGQSKVFTALAGLDVDISSKWRGSVTLLHSQSHDFNQFTGLDLNNIVAAVNTTDPTRSLNLFAQANGNLPSVLASIDDNFVQQNFAQNRLEEASAKADGPLFSLPGGEVRAAVGAEYRQEATRQQQLSGSQAPTSGYFAVTRNDNIKRSVVSGYGELNVPLFSELNSTPGLRLLTVAISGRADHYDRYGTRFNPKFGVVWSPITAVKLRGSYGTNFVAPRVGNLTASFGQIQYNNNPGVAVGYGPYKGTTFTNINNYQIAGGNPNLTPEKATTYSAGIEIAPTDGALKRLRIGVSYYNVKYSNLITIPVLTDLITNPAFAPYLEFFPSADRIAQLVQTVPPTAPIIVPFSNFQLVPTQRAINLGTRLVSGIDYDISYRVPTDTIGNFYLGLSVNQQLQYDQEVVAGSGFASRLDTQDAVKWKGRLSLGWALDPVALNLFVNYTHPYNNTTVAPVQRVGRFVTTDVTASYEIKGLLKGVTVQGRVANLFNEETPFFDSSAGYNGGLASPFPRSVDLTLRAKF